VIDNARILAITGGVGGAKLSLGLTQLLPAGQLAFLVNTGDDFNHLGLHISPDIDTLVYTLSGKANEETGWGRRDEGWDFMAALRELGGEDWFSLGDKDLAMHIERTRLLADGNSLTDVTTQLASALGISHPIFPMCNESLRTRVRTDDATLDFQTYFVRERCAPVVTGFDFDGAANTKMNPDLVAWLQDAPPSGIILCPSNPYVSIDPILQVNGMRDFLIGSDAPVIAVSPVVGGHAIKGPTVKMMQELGIPNTAQSVASHYADFLDGFVLDLEDKEHAASIQEKGIATVVTQTVMRTLDDRVALARDCLKCVQQLSSR
jgi:LPPG:FO 2-phospho-L-lactate transferase